MGRKTGSRHSKPLNIERILNDLKGEQPVISIPADAEPEKIEPTKNASEKPKKKVMHNDFEYDSLKPEEEFKRFTGYIRKCLSQFERDQEVLDQTEREIQDILHYMEMSSNKKRQDGFNIYKRLTEARRERRRCKNEIELLHPVYELFHGTKLLDQLSQLQGSCRIVKESIDNRIYNPRTDVLDIFMEKDDE